MFDSIQDDSCGSKDSEFLETAIKIFRFKVRSEKEAQTLQRPRDLLKSARACFFCIPFNIDLFLLFLPMIGAGCPGCNHTTRFFGQFPHPPPIPNGHFYILPTYNLPPTGHPDPQHGRYGQLVVH